MRKLIRWFDARLSRAYKLVEVSDDPNCILRISPTKASHAVSLPDVDIKPGEPLVGLHLWNDHLLQLPNQGADLSWAKTTQRNFVHSLGLVACYIRGHPQYAQARALFAATALMDGNDSAGNRLLHRLGFTILPYHRRLGRFGEFWENFYSWWLIWAYNPESVHAHHFWYLRRMELWISTEEFLHRFSS